MALDPQLLDILACPDTHHAPLDHDAAAQTLTCRECGRIFEVRAAFPDAGFDELDGMTVHLGDGAWFNLRASNTEPLLRLNVEAPKPDRMAALRDEVLAVVRG